MESQLSSYYVPFSEVSDMLENMESGRGFSSRLDHNDNDSYLQSVLEGDDMLDFYFSKRENEEHPPSNLANFYEPFAPQLGNLESHQSNSSLSSFISTESCFSLQRCNSLPSGVGGTSQATGRATNNQPHHTYSSSNNYLDAGALVTRKSCPPEQIATLHGSSFQIVSPVSNRNSSYSTVEADEDDSSSFDGSQFAKTRRSRARLNYHLDKLRRLLPPPECSSSKKESKSSLIERACKYISYLQQEVRRQRIAAPQ